ncbi:LigT-like protein, partial [Leucogyrophana mollusca]
TGVALWLVPPAAQIGLVQCILPIRPNTPGLSPASYPEITPHITLASVPTGSKITLDDLRKAIPPPSTPIRVQFRALTVGDHYFRSVFVAVHRTDELVALHERIMTALSDVKPTAPVFPHMSLCYIAEDDARERERTAEELRESGKVIENAEEDGVTLVCGAGEEHKLAGFDSEEIWIVQCDGPVEDWQVLEKISLSKRL